MDCLAITLVVFTAALTCVAGSLHCHICLNIEGLEESTSKCNNPGSKFLKKCVSPSSEYTALCGKYDGALTASVFGVEFKHSGLSRECVILPPDNTPENKCYVGDSALPFLMPMIPAGAAQDSVSFDGQVCFCDEVGCNGVGSFQPLVWLLGMLLITAHMWII